MMTSETPWRVSSVAAATKPAEPEIELQTTCAGDVLLATAGRGSSNVYFVDAINRKVLGNSPNPAAGPSTNAERLTSGILIGREPHEPTFTRDARELWVAVRGELSGDLSVPLLLALAVLTWVAGFDLIYACQDEAFDRAHGLHSIPARFGVARALQLSSALHVVTLVSLLACAARAELGWVFGLALAAAGALLVWQHRLVSPTDLSRADVAFFTLNGWVSVALFLGTALDVGLH